MCQDIKEHCPINRAGAIVHKADKFGTLFTKKREFQAATWRIDRLNEEILHSMIYGQIENLSGNTSYNFQIDTVNHTRAMSESMTPTLR